MSSERKILKATRRKKQDYINSLPDEVLCMIFDRLDLYEVKRASETCQRWHSIIFLSGYVNRFVFNVELNSSFCYRNSTNASALQKWIKEFKAMVAKSQRCYRNLYWSVAEYLEDDEFSSVWETIHPTLTNHLHSLEFSLVDASKMLPLIADALPLMSVLRSLTLTDYKGIRGTQDVIPTLRSDSLKHLKIRSGVKYRLDMPHLQSFQGRLSAFHLPDDCREAVALSSLKDLHVYRDEKEDTSRHRIPMLRNLFRLTRLEKIWWDALNSEIFTLICEKCTTLKEFHLEPDNSIVNDLNSLSKLTNLRILVISFCSTDIDLSKVNQLEEVQLLYVNNVVKLPTSIRKLQVLISGYNQEDMRQTICSTQLTELLVEIDKDDKSLKYFAPLDIIVVLPRQKHLKVLKFHRGRFRKSSFLCMDAPLDTLQKLHFEESNVSSKRFLELKEKFPNLNELSFSKCGCWKEIYDADSLSMSFEDSDDSYESSSNSMSDIESDEDD